MNGLAAILEREGRAADPADLTCMTQALGGAACTTPYLAGSAGLAVCGAQPGDPVALFDGQGSLVFDGWLDNRADLLRQLAREDTPRASLPDARLAALSVDRWGLDAFAHWVGEFAAILWDGPENRLVAVRHQFGYRPLCYAETTRRIIVGSSPRAILALGEVPLALNRQKIADALCQVYADGANSYFEGIRRVPPAHYLMASGDRVQTHRYYRLEEAIRPVRYRRDEDYVEAAHEIFGVSLDAALAWSADQGRTVGAFMSGGLDSSTGAVLAARKVAAHGARLETFTSIPEPGWDGRVLRGTYGDETKYVQAIARQHPTISLNLMPATGLGYGHRRDALLAAAQVPLRNVLNTIWYHEILQLARQRGIGTMLGGGLGNLTLSYSGAGVLLEHLRHLRLGRLRREILARGRSPRSIMGTIARRLIAPMSPAWIWCVQRWLRGGGQGSGNWLSYAAARPDFIKAMQVRARAEAAGADFSSRPPKDPRESLIWLLTQQIASETGDALRGWSDLYGITIRDPFSDRRLVEWCLGVPEEQFHRDGTSRWLIRRMMTCILPDKVLHKPAELGLQMSDWHLRMTRDLPEVHADLERFASDGDICEMMDIPRLRSITKAWPEQTLTDSRDPLFGYHHVVLPLALHVGRFIELAKSGFVMPEQIDPADD